MECFSYWKMFYSLLISFMLTSLNFVSKCKAEDSNDQNGKQCIGKHRKPLNEKAVLMNIREINRFEVSDFQTLPAATILENNGQTLVITLNYSGPAPTISDGVLEGAGTFRFEHIYLHWLEKSHPEFDNGPHKFPVELHAVFFNIKYSSMQEALKHIGGIAVMSYSIRIDDSGVPYYNDVIDELVHIRKANSRKSLSEDQLKPLLFYISSEMLEYWAYHGEIVSQYCAVDVLWIDFVNPIVLRPKFAEEINKLRTQKNQPLMNKFTKGIEPAGVVIRTASLADEEENLSGIPFVDTYADDNNRSAIVTPMNSEYDAQIPGGQSIPFVDASDSSNWMKTNTLVSASLILNIFYNFL